MKKRLAFLLLFLSVTVLVGCGKEANEENPTTDASVEQAEVEEFLSEVEGGVESVEDGDFFDEQNPEEMVEDDAQENETGKDEQLEVSQNKEDSSVENSASLSGTEKSEKNSKTESAEKDKNTKPELESVEKLENPEKQEDKEENEQTESTEASMTYESFQKLSPAEQQKYMETFADIESFFVWYNQVKSEYEKENPPIIIDGEEVDLKDLLGGE